MTNQSDYYSILGVHKQASLQEIREAYATLRMSIPEDLRDTEKNPEYQRLVNAYEVLNDKSRRSTYDSLVAETAPLTMKVDILASRDRINKSDAAQLLYLLVEARPPDKTDTQQLPLNLCLVLDRSTSMQGERLKSVKAAVDLLVEKLSTEDRLSVVSFSDRADVVVPAGQVIDKLPIVSKVRGIFASGGTEIYQGLNAGVKELQKVTLNQYTNHLILLTDGHTYGDAEQCLQLADDASLKGIGFSAFGIGAEWNDRFLDKLVAPSGGQSGYIETPKRVIEYLSKRIKGLGHIFAQNVRLKVEFPKSITVEKGFKLTPFAQPLTIDDKQIKLGDVEGRFPISFLLELSVAAQPIETRINIPLTFVADIPDQQMRERTFKNQFQILVIANAPKKAPPNEIVKAVRLLNMYQMNEKVLEEVEAGRLDVATKRMRHLTTRLLQAGETQLAHQAHTEADRIENMGTMSLEGRKKLKYGTRALLDQTINLNSNND
ncbi:MAG: VWA domain-containing protein [Chloroflexi bacterium]|nr:VWA domain-containing protein [Chloroflexota bacterium]